MVKFSIEVVCCISFYSYQKIVACLLFSCGATLIVEWVLHAPSSATRILAGRLERLVRPVDLP